MGHRDNKELQQQPQQQQQQAPEENQDAAYGGAREQSVISVHSKILFAVLSDVTVMMSIDSKRLPLPDMVIHVLVSSAAKYKVADHRLHTGVPNRFKF